MARLVGLLLIAGASLLQVLLSGNYVFAEPRTEALMFNGSVPVHTNAQLQPTQTRAANIENDRYFPLGTPISVMKTKATQITKQQVKLLIEREVYDHWKFIQTQLGFTTVTKAYAFFLGLATRESTLDAGLETGSGPAHSYGALQAAETAYANTNPNYAPENDVSGMFMYTFVPENFYDARIAIHMGIRHLIHFANEAKAANYKGIDMLTHALIGYNTGKVQTSDQNLVHSYADEIGALAGWYLKNPHLQDTTFTWTSDPRVDRSNPWIWY